MVSEPGLRGRVTRNLARSDVGQLGLRFSSLLAVIIISFRVNVNARFIGYILERTDMQRNLELYILRPLRDWDIDISHNSTVAFTH